MERIILEDYDMSVERGFLSRFYASSISLQAEFESARQVAMQLPQMLPTGNVRHLLKTYLPGDDVTACIENSSSEQIRMAMVHYSFMVQAYVWGEAEPAHILPSCLAKPIVAIADYLGQQPLLPYSSYVLDNWGVFDSKGPVDLDNIYMIQQFLGGQDEAWFVLVHVAIEAKAGSVLARMGDIIIACEDEDEHSAKTLLEEIAQIWGELNAIFDRMPERCDPYMYFERVRPYIHGWRDNPALPNGVIYEGVERYGTQGQAFRGQTGSQSSIVTSMDALLGIGHAVDPLKSYLDQLHIYRPTAHRRFIDDVRSRSGLRDFVKMVAQSGLTDAYNANVQGVADFRSRHLEYAASYINKQNKNLSGNDNEVGTGGTPFMKYLKKHRDETRDNLIKL